MSVTAQSNSSSAGINCLRFSDREQQQPRVSAAYQGRNSSQDGYGYSDETRTPIPLPRIGVLR
jgi:hypothetical protein